MGFYITNANEVCADHSIKDFGDTTPEKNPTHDVTQCGSHSMRVTSVFRRDKFRGQKQIGDNCPFIYGVKRKQNLTVGYQGVKPLVEPFGEIMDKFAADCRDREAGFDVIIPMPSSHKIALIVAKRASAVLRVPYREDVFQKATSDDIETQLAAANMPHEAKVNIGSAVDKARDEQRAFSLSDVKTEFRQYISPVTLASGVAGLGRVLLVDDLYATGQTLIAAKNGLIGSKIATSVESLCLFSPLNGRIRRFRKRIRRSGGR